MFTQSKKKNNHFVSLNIVSDRSIWLKEYYGKYYPIEFSYKKKTNLPNSTICFIMQLRDLLNPFWEAIDCDQSVTANILCQFDVVPNKFVLVPVKTKLNFLSNI